MMFLLFSLFAIGGFSQGCYPSDDSKDMYSCIFRAPPICEGRAGCRYSSVNPARYIEDQKTRCMDLEGMALYDSCETHEDCAPGCGYMCINIEGLKSCQGCAQLDDESYCNFAAPNQGLQCKWVGSGYMSECLDKNVGCFGKTLETHNECLKHKYDAEKCLAAGCDFGLTDPYKQQVYHEKVNEYDSCLDDLEEDFVWKECVDVSDCTQKCSTGQACIEWGLDSCVGCFDATDEEEKCKKMNEKGLKCVWIGTGGTNGMCFAPEPTTSPTYPPSLSPTRNPTSTLSPTRNPTPRVTPKPSPEPSPKPTPNPTPKPSPKPSPKPTPKPSPNPTPRLTPRPSPRPTPRQTPSPTPLPTTADPTMAPTIADECMKLGQRRCKNDDRCYWGSSGGKKSCKRNYMPECFGKKVDVHNRCVKDRSGARITTEAHCLKQKPPIGAATCMWGRNEVDMGAAVKQCMKVLDVEDKKACKADLECKCGNRCVKGRCITCRDVKRKGECDGGCKWVGTEKTGVCLQVDTCRGLGEDDCKANSVCKVTDEVCVRVVADRKVCKKRGRGKEALEVRARDCTAVIGCQWSVKQNGKHGSCKFGGTRKNRKRNQD